MSSPKWCECREAPIGAAIAAAQHAAWTAPEERRYAVFSERLRQLVGPERFEAIAAHAIALYTLQPSAPAGWEEPPESAYYSICPSCQTLRRTKYTVPQNGRLKLAVLRDPEWMQRQVERGRTLTAIAKQLRCTESLVGYWLERHGLVTARTERAEMYEERVPDLHARGFGPGAIAKELGTTSETVRRVLHRLGLAHRKSGHVYHAREWWVERIERRGWSVAQCARDAGIKAHAATYYIRKFGLTHITAERACKKGKSKWRPRYPQIADAKQLAQLILEYGTYEEIARRVGCAPSLVSDYARKLLGADRRHENIVPHAARVWWTERLDRGMTTWAMAEEAGVSEKTARERLRLFGMELLAQGYRNNTAAERARRKSA